MWKAGSTTPKGVMLLADLKGAQDEFFALVAQLHEWLQLNGGTGNRQGRQVFKLAYLGVATKASF